jgi:hypothetical protein
MVAFMILIALSNTAFAAPKNINLSVGISKFNSVSYKNGEDISKQTFWIIKEEGKTYYYDYDTMPVACDSKEVHEYIKEVAARRKITIEELGGLEES